MVFAGELLFLVELLLLVYCVLSIITTPDDEVRHLPKLVWLVLVVVLPLAGGLAWLVAGRARDGGPSLPYRGRGGPSVYERPRPVTATSPDDDAAFLRGLQERADAQRAEAARRRREEREREDRGRDEAGPE